MSNRKYLLRITDARSYGVGSNHNDNTYNLLNEFTYNEITYAQITEEVAYNLSDLEYENRCIKFLMFLGIESQAIIDSLVADVIT
jgi:hypothetical protein